MTIPILWVNHMANGRKTYEWVNGRIREAVPRQLCLDPTERPRPFITLEQRPHMGIQTGLLVFTASSLVFVFAGGALIAFLCILFAVITG
jgi:hypothetical protein